MPRPVYEPGVLPMRKQHFRTGNVVKARVEIKSKTEIDTCVCSWVGS